MHVDLQVLRVPDDRHLAFFCADFCYRLTNGTQFDFFGVDVVWCHQCEDFSLAEKLPSVESIQSRLSYEEDPRLNPTEMSDVLAWRLSRKSGPKCLQCGSQFGIRKLPLDQEVDHPKGGCRILVTVWRTLYAPRATTFFDAEGNQLAGVSEADLDEQELSDWLLEAHRREWRRST
jgi:hypothetical protein